MFCMLNCINFLIAKMKMESWKIKKHISFHFISLALHWKFLDFGDISLSWSVFSEVCLQNSDRWRDLDGHNKCDLKNVKLLIVEEKIPRQNKNQTIDKIFGRRFPHTIFWRFTYTTKGCVGYWRTRKVAKNKVFSLIHILKTLINLFS